MKKIYVVGLIVLLVALSCGGVYYFSQNKNNDDKEYVHYINEETIIYKMYVKDKTLHVELKDDFAEPIGLEEELGKPENKNIGIKNLPNNIKYFTYVDVGCSVDSPIDVLALTENGEVYEAVFEPDDFITTFDTEETEYKYIKDPSITFKKVDLNGHTAKDITSADITVETGCQITCMNENVFIVDENNKLRVITEDYKIGETYDEVYPLKCGNIEEDE